MILALLVAVLIVGALLAAFVAMAALFLLASVIVIGGALLATVALVAGAVRLVGALRGGRGSGHQYGHHFESNPGQLRPTAPNCSGTNQPNRAAAAIS